MGKRYLLKIRQASDTQAQVRLLRGRLEVSACNTEPQAVRDAMEQWYRSRAQNIFARRLAELCPKLKWVNSLPQWQLRPMSKQWGSCSPKGRLSLNPLLVKASRACIDYVIIHELCHLRYHNHSKDYYRLLEKTLPDWKATKQRLDNMAELFLI
jgi:predicted metal-dependent hydrolase